MYPTATQLDELCTIIKPSFPQMDIHEQTDMRYRIRDAYHLVTTGQQAPVWPDELDVKDALPELQKRTEAQAKLAEEKRLKEKEIQTKLDEAIFKIDETQREAAAKAEAQRLELKTKADAEKAKLEAEAQAEAAKLAERDEKKKVNNEPPHPAQRKG